MRRMSLVLMLALVSVAGLYAQAELPLVIEGQEVLPGEGGVRLVLRNVSAKTITAWSIRYEAGSTSGSVTQASSTRDSYHMEPFAEKGSGPLLPGESATHEIRIAGIDLSPGRFEKGNYSVFSGRVSAVFFNDGEALGDDVRMIERVVARRVAEVAATIEMRRQLESLGRADADTLIEGVRQTVAAATDQPQSEIESVRREQAAWRFALGYAKNFLAAVDREEDPELVLAGVFARLDVAIANGLKNLPRAEREALR